MRSILWYLQKHIRLYKYAWQNDQVNQKKGAYQFSQSAITQKSICFNSSDMENLLICITVHREVQKDYILNKLFRSFFKLRMISFSG